MEKTEAIVYTSTRRPRPRKGRGFSLKEIKDAGLTPQEAKTLRLTIDVRRKTSHTENVEVLKEEYGTVVLLTEIKGIGKTAEKKLIEADILDAADLASANLGDLTKKVPYSKQRLQKWRTEAERLLKKQK